MSDPNLSKLSQFVDRAIKRGPASGTLQGQGGATSAAASAGTSSARPPYRQGRETDTLGEVCRDHLCVPMNSGLAECYRLLGDMCEDEEVMFAPGLRPGGGVDALRASTPSASVPSGGAFQGGPTGIPACPHATQAAQSPSPPQPPASPAPLTATDVRVHALETENHQLEQLLITKEKQIDAFTSALNMSDKEECALKLSMYAVNLLRDTATLRCQLLELEKSNAELKKRISQSSDETRDAQEQIAAKRKEIAHQMELVVQRDRYIGDLESELCRVKTQSRVLESELRGRYDALKADLDTKMVDISAYESLVESLRAEILSKHNRILLLEGDASRHQAAMDEKTRALEASHNANGQLHAELNRVAQASAAKDKYLCDLEAQLKSNELERQKSYMEAVQEYRRLSNAYLRQTELMSRSNADQEKYLNCMESKLNESQVCMSRVKRTVDDYMHRGGESCPPPNPPMTPASPKEGALRIGVPATRPTPSPTRHSVSATRPPPSAPSLLQAICPSMVTDGRSI